MWISVKPVADEKQSRICEAGSGLNRTPLCRYNNLMVRLSVLQSKKVNVYLKYLSDLLEVARLSKTAPRDSDNRLSLPLALAILCGAPQSCQSDDFDYLLEKVPSLYSPMFVLCWEVMEAEVQDDIVAWSEKVGTDATVRRIRTLAKVIEHA